MPDDDALPEASATSDTGEAGDSRLLRRVHWRLVAWSGGLTLVVLLVLGVAIYVAVADSLATSATDQLERRAYLLTDALTTRGEAELEELEMAIGGSASGTFAFVVEGDRVVGPEFLRVPEGLPDPASIAAARSRGRDLREGTVSEVPVRILSVAIRNVSGQPVVQVVQQRGVEQRTLGALLKVLVLGGLPALVAAMLVGAAYGRRALVPIRRSLQVQRAALSRQQEFAADASHELRTPLAIIRASVEHLRHHRDQRVGEVGSAVDDIDAEATRLSALVDDLLLLARSDSGALDMAALPLDLGDVTADAAAALVAVATRSDTRIVLDPEPVMVVGDPDRLRQVVTILVDNAIKHSPGGGEVDIRVRQEHGHGVLTVDDQGPGISPEDASRVFDRFWRASGAPSGGSGLGLSIAAAIVGRLGGDITAGPAPGGGARLTVTLPTLDSRESSSSTRSQEVLRKDP